MSNVKDVHISGSVPFTWLDGQDYGGELSDEEVAWFGRLFLNPTIGLRIDFSFQGYSEPNEHGGKTAIYGFTVSGQEAIAYPAIDRLVELVEKAGGEVEANIVHDLEAV